MPDDRRESRRFPVLEGREKIELKIGRRLIGGRLVDISAGGFAVEVPPDERPRMGTQVEMRTCDGTHIVQIARIVRLESATCLGLVRVEDVLVPERMRRRDRRMSRAGNPLFLLPVTVGVAVCGLTIWATCLGPEWTKASVLQPAYDSLARAFNFDEGRKLRARFGAPASEQPQPVESQPAETAAGEESTDGEQSEEIGSSWTAWSDYMELSADQFRELKSRLSDKFEQMQPSQLDELPSDRQQTIDDVLSSDQRQRLKEFLSSRKSR
jgi:hypothetical protein